MTHTLCRNPDYREHPALPCQIVGGREGVDAGLPGAAPTRRHLVALRFELRVVLPWQRFVRLRAAGRAGLARGLAKLSGKTQGILNS